jgi:PhoH-like ATPase
MKGKKYVLDTSVILDSLSNIIHLSQNNENTIIVTDIVLRELESKKTQMDETGFFARSFFQSIDGSRVEFDETYYNDVLSLVKFTYEGQECNITLVNRPEYKTKNMEHSLNDGRILEIAMDYKAILITNDIALLVLALSKKCPSEQLKTDVVSNPNDIKFHHKLITNDIENTEEFQKATDWASFEVAGLSEDESYETGISRFGIKLQNRFEEIDFNKIKATIPPVNLAQKMFYSMMIHPNNQLTVCSGATGSGKTLMALQAGIQLVEEEAVDGIVYIRNTVTASARNEEIGFLKGSESDKMSVFMYPLYTAVNTIVEELTKNSIKNKAKFTGDLNSIHKQEATELFMQELNITYGNIAHLRGVTFKNKFVILDEAQNNSNASLKLIGTRMGEGTKLIILGDYKQVDNQFLTRNRNGLVTSLRLADSENLVAGCRLPKTVRSELAEFFDTHFA